MAINMTKGSVSKHLTSFAVPLILGNVFQLTYNAVDSIIVGRYVGSEALAAVGTSSPVMNIVIFFIVGICTGTSVLMSEYYGAQDIAKLKREISTSMLSGMIFSIAMTAAGFYLSPYILAWMNTPSEIIGIGTGYLRIIFAGLVFTFLYNIYAAALRSVGDSRTPVFFLIISSVINMVLDYIFVVWYHMGVNGVAVATVISQMVSSVLCIIYVNIKVPLVRLSVKELRIDRGLLKNTINNSWVTGMQQICLYVGKVLVQRAVNTLGVDSMAAFNAVTRVDDFAFQPQQSIGSSMTIFIAQNRGAKNKERMNAGLYVGLFMEVISWVLIAVIVFVTARPVMHLFMSSKRLLQLGSSSQVVDLGVDYLQHMAFFYLLPAFTNGIQGYFRGMGDLKITLLSTAVQMAGRVSFAYLLIPQFGMTGIAFSCLGGWICMLVFELPFFYMSRRNSRK